MMRKVFRMGSVFWAVIGLSGLFIGAVFGASDLEDSQRVASDPTDPVLALIEAGRYPQALEELDRLEKVHPGHPKIPKLRQLVLELEREPDATRRRVLLTRYTLTALDEMTGRPHVALKELDALDDRLSEASGQEREEQLRLAAAEGKAWQVKALLDRGTNPNACDRFGATPLHQAANAGHLDIIRILIGSGADPNARGLLGVTPLMLAAGAGHLEAVKLLIEAGADVRIKTESGISALMRAEQNHHTEVADLLRAAGATE